MYLILTITNVFQNAMRSLIFAACLPEYFGANCAKQCSSYCKGKRTCDRFTGICDEGCDYGLSGRQCGTSIGILFLRQCQLRNMKQEKKFTGIWTWSVTWSIHKKLDLIRFDNVTKQVYIRVNLLTLLFITDIYVWKWQLVQNYRNNRSFNVYNNDTVKGRAIIHPPSTRF